MYVDVMDRSRMIEPVSQGLKQCRCRIYFDGIYAGMADCPTGLFGDDTIGYVRWEDPTEALKESDD